jgi:peptidoglycan DL-endopeptidase CwlO
VTQRITARHRDARRASTPLSGLTEALNTVALAPAANLAGRGGLAIAVSSGLVAALPASGALQTNHQMTTATGSVPMRPPTSDALASPPVTAPPNAMVAFEHNAFQSKAKHVATDLTPGQATRDVSSVSRSLARAAYRAQVRASTPRVTRPRILARQATPRSTAPATTAPVPANSSRGAAVVAIALRYLGVPYVYGGATPRGFDCSGFSMYVYRQLGITLPRTTQQQYNATTRIARSQAAPGDLVFFFSGGYVTHVGIYLGGNMMVAAPHTGTVVRKQDIYSANVAFGRV